MHRIPYLIAAGVCGQLFGNVCFQASLHIVGIAVAVPLVLGSMIVSGAFIGWFVLGERVTRRTMVGIVLLIVALGIISMGAGAVQEKVGAESSGLHQVSTAILLLALAGNIAGGISYSIMGTVMRRSFQQGMLPEMAMLVLSIVGFVLLGFISTFRIDLQSIQLIRSLDWIAMGFAGVFNALAFFALSIALKNLNLISVHMLNATQATLALLAGFLIFNEPMTIYLPVGLAFTVVGLLVAGYRKGRDSGMKTGTTTDAKTGPETGTETTALPHVSLANNTANSSVLTAEPDVLEARSEIGHS
jgi:drug/metabolite transporter (DMT)-like permease